MTQSADRNLTEKFWERLDDCRTGMLVVDGRAVPMSHYIDENHLDLWFMTARGTFMSDHADGSSAHFIVCNDDKGLYASLTGILTPDTDPAKVEEYWNAVAAAWYEDGKQDSDLQLLRFRLQHGEVWTAKDGAAFLFQIVKANVTGDKPDIGEHFEMKF